MSRRSHIIRAAAVLFSAGIYFSPAGLSDEGIPPAGAEAAQPEQQRALATFLDAPVDLQAFKKQKGSSNSGVMTGEGCFFRPAGKGFYQWYGLFPTPRGVPESRRLSGLRLIVYSFNERPGDYSDSDEMLIAVRSAFPDPDLGDANLVGSAVEEIRRRFGEPKIARDDLLLYHRDGRALSLHISEGRIDWYKYVRLNRELGVGSDIPGWLTGF